MLERYASITVPSDVYYQDLLSAAIGDYVLWQVLQKCNNDVAKASQILKAPSFFCLSDSFILKEYLKNTSDNGKEMQNAGNLPSSAALHIELYAKINSDNSSVCLIKDDGSGFPDKFLARNENESMVDYYQKKLISADGKELQHIVSSKSIAEMLNNEGKIIQVTKLDKQGAKGGQGSGLATAARILHKVDEANHMMIGNVSDLPQEFKSQMSILGNDIDHGAVIMVNAIAFDEMQMENFKDLKETSLLKRYVHYVNHLDENLKKMVKEPEDVNNNLIKITNMIAGMKIEDQTDDEKEENISPSSVPDEKVEFESSPSSLGFVPKSKPGMLDLSVDDLNIDNELSEIETEPVLISSIPVEPPTTGKRLGLFLNLGGVNIEDNNEKIEVMQSAIDFIDQKTDNDDFKIKLSSAQGDEMSTTIISRQTSQVTQMASEVKDEVTVNHQSEIPMEVEPVNQNSPKRPNTP